MSNGIIDKFRLNGKVGLVTGGGQGIGRGIAHALGEAGAKVVVADLILTRAQTVVEELKAKGIECIALEVDVSKKSEVELMVEKVLEKYGDLNIACNNAGILTTSASENTSEEEWKKVMGVNLDGVFFSCQAEAKHMLKNGYGKIINTASISGTVVLHPQNNITGNVSKAGVIHLTKTLAAEWADRGIRVNSISPGYIKTPLNQAPHLVAVQDRWIRDIPMRKLGEVDDLVGAAVFLASPLSDYITGHDLIIDGGLTLW